MNVALQSFLSVALAIVVTILIAAWSNGKAFDTMNRRFDDLRGDMNKRFDKVDTRLERIEQKLDNHEQRIVRIEERTSIVHR